MADYICYASAFAEAFFLYGAVSGIPSGGESYNSSEVPESEGKMEKKRSFIISVLFYLIIGGIVYVVLRYAIFVVMPFLIGFLIAASLNPITRYLTKKYSLKRKPTAVLILLLFYATVGMLATVLIVRAVAFVGDVSGRLPGIYSETVEPLFERASLFVDEMLDSLGKYANRDFFGTVGGLIDSAKNSVGTAVSDISVRVIAWLSGFAASVPRFVVELIFSVIAGFFFVIDYEEIVRYAKSRLPRKAVGIMTELKSKFFVTVARYLRSYTLIMLLTFAELTVGLLLIGTKNAVMPAFFISLFDALPVLGSGMIMVPWAVIELMRGRIRYGIGLLVLWGAVTVIRNIVEPRIVGKQVGLHPLCTLIAMFVGTKLFGFVGLILLPMGLSIVFSVLRDRDYLSSGM